MEGLAEKKLKGVFVAFKKMKNSNNHEDTLRELLKKELDEALESLDVAQANFDNASPEYIEIANEELTIANNKINLLIKKLKKIGNI